MLSNKTIAVTGSSGFIGSRLVSKLKELNAKIITMDYAQGLDISDWSQMEHCSDFDTLIHLAAKIFVPESFEDPRNFYHTNIVSTLNVLEMCRMRNARMIFASSYVYGVPQYLPIDENHPLKAFNPYSESKIIGERLCHRYHQDFGIPIVILRPFNIYGTKQDTRFLIPTIIQQAQKGIIKLKDPKPKRDFIYIDDMINAYIKAIFYEKKTFDIFNIGFGKSYSIQEIVNEVAKHSTLDLEVSHTGEQRKTEVYDTVSNITRAREYLGWKPEYSFERGIELCYKNESQHLD